MTVPGVGPVTALTFKAGVDDPGRFESSRNVAAHFGLTPRRYQSGEVDNPGHISRAGDADVRSALYVAAHSLLTRNAQWSSLEACGLPRHEATGAQSLPSRTLRTSPNCTALTDCANSVLKPDRTAAFHVAAVVVRAHSGCTFFSALENFHRVLKALWNGRLHDSKPFERSSVRLAR